MDTKLCPVRRDPRLNSYLVHNARGGYFDFQPRDNRLPPQRVDTVPSHAVKPDGEMIGREGIVLPIINGLIRPSKVQQ